MLPYTYVRRIDVQPVLDFMINQVGYSGDTEFYINTYGVSISENNKSITTFENGLFYILNKNSQSIYFNSLNITSIKFRNENAYLSNALAIIQTATTTDETYNYYNYNVNFKGNNIGVLQIRSLLNYSNSSNSVIYPFQSLEFNFSALIHINYTIFEVIFLVSLDITTQLGSVDLRIPSSFQNQSVV